MLVKSRIAPAVSPPSHDAVGLVTARIDQNGVTADLGYDDLNRLTGVEFTQGAAELYKHEYGYNRSGRLMTAKKLQDSATTAEWAFVYDALGRRTLQTQQIAGLAGTYETGFEYAVGATSAVTMIYPGGHRATHSYDLRFRPVGVSSSADENSLVDVLGSWTFDIANRPMTADIGNATTADILTAAFGFDALDRLTQVKHEKSGDPATTLFHENYTYDDVGNRLSTEKVHDSGNSEVYVYDARDRLTVFQRGTLNQAVTPPTVETPTTSGLLNRGQDWMLDANSNWTSTTIERPGGTVTEARQVNAVNEYTKIGYVPTNHDANGNMLFDGQRAYTYDVQNRVTSIYNVCLQGITEFAYGPLGEQTTETRNGVTTYRIYVGTDVIAEYTADGDRFREYLDGPAGKLAMVDYTPAGNVAVGSPEVFFYLVGHLGSIVALTDANGDVVERYAYEPYGQTIITDPSGAPRSASAYGNPYAWTGQRYDADNQLYHFYFRTYSPHLGRWLQRDGLGYGDGLNLYQYVMSGPMRYEDWLGLNAMSWWNSLTQRIGDAVRYLGIAVYFQGSDDDQVRDATWSLAWGADDAGSPNYPYAQGFYQGYWQGLNNAGYALESTPAVLWNMTFGLGGHSGEPEAVPLPYDWSYGAVYDEHPLDHGLSVGLAQDGYTFLVMAVLAPRTEGSESGGAQMVPLESAKSSNAVPSMLGFTTKEAAMLGEALRVLNDAGYDVRLMKVLIKADDMPRGYRGMSLPDGAALGPEALGTLRMVLHVLEEKLIHRMQKQAGLADEFGPGTAKALEDAVNATRKFPEPRCGE